jgi:hypothetical protein
LAIAFFDGFRNGGSVICDLLSVEQIAMPVPKRSRNWLASLPIQSSSEARLVSVRIGNSPGLGWHGMKLPTLRSPIGGSASREFGDARDGPPAHR